MCIPETPIFSFINGESKWISKLTLTFPNICDLGPKSHPILLFPWGTELILKVLCLYLDLGVLS